MILKKPIFIFIVLSLVSTLILAVPQSALAFPPAIPCPPGTTLLAIYEWEDPNGDGVKDWIWDEGKGADVIDFLGPSDGYPAYDEHFGWWMADPGVLVKFILITDGNGNPGGTPVVDWGVMEFTTPTGGPATYDGSVMQPDPTKDISNLEFCGQTYPVTLASFTARANRGTVSIDWITATEINTAGFLLYRSTTADGPQVQLTETLIVAQGSGVTGASYRVTDTPGYGIFYYWLRDVDYSGQSSLHGPIIVKVLPAIRQPVSLPSLPGQ